jgi:hypothetical protein
LLGSRESGDVGLEREVEPLDPSYSLSQESREASFRRGLTLANREFTEIGSGAGRADAGRTRSRRFRDCAYRCGRLGTAARFLLSDRVTEHTALAYGSASLLPPRKGPHDA